MSLARKLSCSLSGLLCIVCLLLAACGRGSDNSQTKELATEEKTPVAQQSTAAADSTFLLDAYSYGIMLVQYNELAVLQAQRKDVKSFAEQSASWHKALSQELSKFADQQGLSMPKVAGENVHQYMNELRELPADRFEARYLQVLQEIQAKMIRVYEQQEAALEAAATDNTANPELQRHVSEKLPDLHAHAQAVKELASQVKN